MEAAPSVTPIRASLSPDRLCRPLGSQPSKMNDAEVSKQILQARIRRTRPDPLQR